MDWFVLVPLGSALVGTIIGGGITYFTQVRILRREREDLRRSLALALAAEIEGFAKLMVRRRVVDRLQQAATNNASLTKGWMSSEDRRETQFPVFTNNVNQIGILGPICAQVVELAMNTRAVRTTLIAVDEGDFDHLAPQGIAYLFNEEHGLAAETLQLAGNVAADLRDIGAGRWVKSRT